MKDNGAFDIAKQEMSSPARRLFIGFRLVSLAGLVLAVAVAELFVR